jgi:hypothetical protein
MTAARGRVPARLAPSRFRDAPARAARPSATGWRRRSSPSPSWACAPPCSFSPVPWPPRISSDDFAVLQQPFCVPSWPMRQPNQMTNYQTLCRRRADASRTRRVAAIAAFAIGQLRFRDPLARARVEVTTLATSAAKSGGNRRGRGLGRPFARTAPADAQQSRPPEGRGDCDDHRGLKSVRPAPNPSAAR